VIEPIPEDVLKFEQEAARIRFSKAMLDARVFALQSGATDEELCARIRWTLDKWRATILSPRSLDSISDVCLACGCLISVGSISIRPPSPTPSPNEDGEPNG